MSKKDVVQIAENSSWTLVMLLLLLLYPLFLAYCQSKIFLFLLKVVVETCDGISGKRRAENKKKIDQRTQDVSTKLLVHVVKSTIQCPWLFVVHDHNVMASNGTQNFCCMCCNLPGWLFLDSFLLVLNKFNYFKGQLFFISVPTLV